MKKLLVLVLVLAMASLANAVVWTGAYNAGTGIVSVSITENAGQMYLALALTDGSGTLSLFAKGTDAPVDSAMSFTMGSGMDFEGYGEGEIWAMAHLTTGTPVFNDGQWLVATYTGSTPATATMYEFDGSATFTEMGDILIPEPITMSLLGLGGLFLRRRK